MYTDVAIRGIMEDVAEADGPDLHGLRARIEALGYSQRGFAREHGMAPNSLRRAITTDLPSPTRQRVQAVLDRLERAAQTPQPESEGEDVFTRIIPASYRVAEHRTVRVEVDGVLYVTVIASAPDVSIEDARLAVREHLRRTQHES